MRRSGALLPLVVGLVIIAAIYLWLPASFYTLSAMVVLIALIWSLVRWRRSG